MGAGWGSIFIVILVIMLCVYLLNRIFRSKGSQIKTARALPKAAPALCVIRSFLRLRFEAVALGDEPAFDPGAAAFLLLGVIQRLRVLLLPLVP